MRLVHMLTELGGIECEMTIAPDSVRAAIT